MQIKLSAIITKKNFAAAILKAFLLPDKKGMKIEQKFSSTVEEVGWKIKLATSTTMEIEFIV